VDNLKTFLTTLHANGIHLFVDQGKLKSRADPGAITQEIGSKIKANKEAIIDLLEQSMATDSQTVQIDKAPADTIKRLSFAQQRLWLLDQIDGGSSHYNMPAALKFSGDLNISALQQALVTIVSRHESLRTCIVQGDDGHPVQVIRDGLDFNVVAVDISSFADESQSVELNRRVEDEANRWFDLSRDLMLRSQLLKLSASEHVLLITMHHIVSDGWSMGILIKEFSELYVAYAQGKDNPLVPLDIQYADYAHWQRNWLQGEVLDQQLGYWTNQLADLPKVHHLPLDHARPKEQTFDGEMYVSRIGLDCQEKLKSFCQQHDATLFMGLHALFSVLLSRYSNETDIVVGSPIANREQAEIAPLIGFFVNTLVLRSDLSANPTFNQLLLQSKQMLLAAYEHQQVPFEQIVEQLKPARDITHNPLFQIMLVLHNNEQGALELPGVSLSRVSQEDKITAKFELTLNVTETKRGMVLGWEYNTNLFDGKSIDLMAQHFEQLLEALLAAPQQNVLQANMLSEKEHHQRLVQWQGEVEDHSSDKCIHELFEAQVANNPGAIALVFDQPDGERKELNYAELNEQANRLAHYLVAEKQIAPDRLVGICVERSLEMFVGIIAVLKAGGAYVPLDPSNPEARLSYIFEDAGLTTILTQSHLSQSLPFDAAGVVCLDDNAFLAALNHYPASNIPPTQLSVNAASLAYVIYTSGSTGMPKGVLIEHCNVSRLFDACGFGFSFGSDDVWTMFHSFAFDFSVWEIWGALFHGGRLIIVPQDITRSTADFYRLLEQEKVTVLNQTPTAFTQLAIIGAEQGVPLSLRYVVFGGEALNLKSLSSWIEQYGDSTPQLINMYGITETTVHTSFKRITWENIEQDGEASLIGVPLADLEILLLNPQQALVPIGVSGEMYIGGAGLARGYLNRPELTAERFINNPFYDPAVKNSSKRLYRSGDLARWLADGSLEYLGRIDHQVKIRGFRIELGEIEHALLCHHQVNDVVVLAKSTEDGDKRLAAYVATDQNVALNDSRDKSQALRHEFIESLRKLLQQDLPDYMVPQVFVILDRLPLTANGKVDHKALPEPDMAQQKGKYLAPATVVEQKLCDIWQEVLRIENIGISDNFFELGGDSILSIQVVSRAIRAGLHFSVKELFATQTIEQLAPLVKSGSQIMAPQNAVTGKQKLLPIQNIFFSDEIDLHHYNQSVLLTTPEDFDHQAMKEIVRKLYERHDALRLKFNRSGTDWVSDYQPLSDAMVEATVEIKKWQQDSFDGIKDYANTIQESLRPEQGLLFKAVNLHLDGQKGQGRLLLVIHHLAVDGVSWRVLLEDIETLYGQWQAKSNLTLAKKTSSYQQWGDFLHKYAGSEALAEEHDYWFESFKESVTPLHDLLEKTTKSTGQQKATGTVSFSLNETLTGQLLHQSNSAYRTQINELLLASVLLGAHRSTETKAIRLDLEGHGREMLSDEVDLSQTVGWFTTIYPLTLSLAPEGSLADLICMVKESYRAIPNKGIGFGVLQHICQNPAFKDLPSSELVFNYLGQFDQVVNSDTQFGQANESGGNNISPARKVTHPLTLNGMVSGGRLSFALTFDHALYDTSAVQILCDNISKALKQIIEHCIATERGRYTPSDFPLAQVSKTELLEWECDAEIADLYPATGIQQGLLFHSMLHQGSYVIQNVLRFEKLDSAKFKKAWQQVIHRHNVFRTAFTGLVSGNTHQLVYPDVSLPWHEEDLSALDQAAQREQVENLRVADQLRGFEPTVAPLMRFRVLHMGEDVQQVIWSYHHALMDGWCLPLVIGEVTECYRALLVGETPRLKTVRSYQRYAVWLAQQDRQLAVDFWREQMHAITEQTQLPLISTDVQTENVEAGTYEYGLAFDAAQTEQLVQLAQKTRTTVNILVQAAWALLLSRYSGDLKVVFGAVTSGRPPQLPGVEEIIGLFINSLPVVVDIDEQQTVVQWLAQLQQQQVDRESYNYLPLHDIQQLANSDQGVFDSLVVFENYPVDEAIEEKVSGAALQLQGVESFTGTNYAMTLVADLGKTLSLKLQVKQQLLSDSQVSQISNHLQQLLLNLACSGDALVGEIGMLNDEQTDYQLNGLNDTVRDYPEDQCIHQLFEAQVNLCPDNIAAVFQQEQLSYQQLNHKANRLAHLLIESGIESGDCVGIYLERSLEMLIAVLAVMKSGGAYVPMEPNGPGQRAKLILEDANVDMVLLKSVSMESLPTSGVDILLMDDAGTNEGWLEEYSDANPDGEEIEVNPQSLVYILYTSGSTGRPKGVMVPHRGVVNYLKHALESYLSADMSGSVVSSPLCFDATITTLLTPLCAGKSVTMLPENDQTLTMLGEHLFSDQPRLFKITPAHLVALAYMHTDAEPVNSHHRIVVGGEQLTVQTLKKWKQQLLPNAVFVNEYGPTETVVGCSVFNVSELADLNLCQHAVAIGKPIINTGLYVLNNGRIAPVGSVGELHISGAGVAEGYQTQALLSEDKFINHKFENSEVRRLYKTGDLVRYLADGNLEFMGRIDDQVKLRGFRIEPGEIESLLNDYPGVDESLVLLTGEGEEQHLAAYLVARDVTARARIESALAGDIIEYLTDKLPHYMVPSLLFVLECLPLTLNGKVDKRALPSHNGAVEQQSFVAPQTDTEKWLAQLWQPMLNNVEIGSNSDFFRAGGHSLLAMRFISALAKEHNVEISLNALFEHSVLADLAVFIDQQEHKNYSPINVIDRNQPLPLSYPQRRLWFIDKFGQGSAQYNIPISIRLSGKLDQALLQSTLTSIVDRHEVLRSSYHDSENGPVQMIEQDHGFTISITNLTALSCDPVEQERQVNVLVSEEAGKAFDLRHDLMLRVSLLVLSEQESVVQFVMHHIASDGWSLDVLVNEFVALYSAGYHGLDNPLAPLPIQYTDFANWQVNDFTEQRLSSQLTYWQQQLKDIPQVHALPLDRARPAKQEFSGGGYDYVLDGDLLKQLHQVAEDNGVTLFMLLHSAFALLLGRWSNEKDIVIGSPVAGRSHPDVESLIGFFVSTLVFRTQLDENQSFEQMLEQNKAMILAAFDHQDVPFETLVDELKVPRSLSHSPLFQVIFTMQNRGKVDISLPDLTLSSVPGGAAKSKFDLELVVTEQADKLFVSWTYAKSLFDHQTIVSLGNGLQILLQQIADCPAAPAYQYGLLDKSQNKLIEQINNTSVQQRDHQTLHQWFESQVELTPDNCALVNGEVSLTYRELNAKANQLAHALQQDGIKMGCIVALCARRSATVVVAVLAIMKTGAAYLPLDPSLPKNRLEYMATDSGAALILVEEPLMASLPFNGCNSTALGTLESFSYYPTDNLTTADADLASLCYIIYTSGSTGLPKGVMVPHSGVINYLDHALENYLEQHIVGAVLSSPLSFDATVTTLFSPLLCGRSLMVLPEAQDAVISGLIGYLNGTDNYLFKLTPAHLDLLNNSKISGDARHIIVIGGEQLNVSSLLPWKRDLLPNSVYVNEYGPTETVVGCTTFWVRNLKDINVEISSVSIGQPIRNTQVHILRDGQPVPVGAVGELYIGGNGVTSGYLNREDLSAEKFIASHRGVKGLDMLYRSGDLVRFRHDGQLEFVGRIDDQLKIRGYRIEAGEIEMQLVAHDKVKEVVVVADGEGNEKHLIAYYVPEQDVPTVTELKQWLKVSLAEYMIPATFMAVDEFRLTTNGKVDKKALPKVDQITATSKPRMVSKLTIEQQLHDIWCELLVQDKVASNDNFFELGGNSMLSVQVQKLVAERTAYSIELTDIFEYPTIASLTAYLAGEEIDDERANQEIVVPTNTNHDIAVIGMSGRFPGAANVDQFWQNISSGIESVQFYSEQQLLDAGISSNRFQDPNYIQSGYVIEGLEYFDANYYSFSPREAELLDPQQRFMLECATEALEHGGYGDQSRYRNVGVFVGIAESKYLMRNILPNDAVMASTGKSTFFGNSSGFSSTLLSYKLNLTGPSINILTACSTSLVSVHQACNSLLLNECEMALAGASSITLLKPGGYTFEEGGIVSPDGHCRPFDKDARGTRAGSGAGALLLKRLDKALADKDTIHAVIKGTGINNDAADKVGYTAPSVGGQTDVIKQALKKAAVPAESIEYVEAHGTGTPIGDPIEVKALQKAYASDAKGFCALGSLKANIGHLDTAAGAAGLIKAIQAIKHRQIPPSINFNQSNSQIDFAKTPFYINTELKPWHNEANIRRAGISSFGIGGTNAHVIIEQAPEVELSSSLRDSWLLPVSAMSKTALNQACENLRNFLQQDENISLHDVAYTLQVGRTRHEYSTAVACESREEAIALLSQKPKVIRDKGEHHSVVFMFPGQGSQYVGMAQQLYAQEPLFKSLFDGCAEKLMGSIGADLRSIIYPQSDADASQVKDLLNQTSFTQPALFVVEYCIAKLLQSWGIEPEAMIGHSIGEYVAACLAGVFNLTDALMLVSARGSLMQQVAPGSMLSVEMAPEELAVLLTQTGTSLASVNAPGNCVAAGDADGLEQLITLLDQQQVEWRKLHTSHAFHSSMMDSILLDFKVIVEKVSLAAPAIRYVSNVTGEFITPEQVQDPQYWVDHLRGTVHFAAGVDTIFADNKQLNEIKVVIEIGPGISLSTLARKSATARDHALVSTIRHPNESVCDMVNLQNTLGKLWGYGVVVDWQAFHEGHKGRRVPLPTYPFEKQRYWIDPLIGPQNMVVNNTGKLSQENWWYVPTWQQKPVSRKAVLAQQHAVTSWLLIMDQQGVGETLAQQLTSAGHQVVKAKAGTHFSQLGDAEFSFNILHQADYDALLAAAAVVAPLCRVVHLGGIDVADQGNCHDIDDFQQVQKNGVLSALYTVKAIVNAGLSAAVKVDLISSDIYRITGEEIINPAKATLTSLVKVAPQEYPELECQHIDISLNSHHGSSHINTLSKRLHNELILANRSSTIAIRGNQRWEQKYQGDIIDPDMPPAFSLKDDGVYLITGGLGNIGLLLASYISKTVKNARLILVGRSAMPAEQYWDQLLNEPDNEVMASRIAKIREIQANGAQVAVFNADVADLDEMQALFASSQTRFGQFNGIIHCAGQIHGSMKALVETDKADFDQQYRSKVEGVMVLDQLLASHKPDFCLLMSSLSSILGGLGFTAYAAGNVYMDAFVQNKHDQGDDHWISVNWDGWNFSGNMDNVFAMTPLEGEQAFSQVLTGAYFPQVINSTGSLELRLSQWIDKNVSSNQNLYARPDLDTEYIQATNEVEEKLITIWQDILGFEQIGIEDHFFDLGGDSLMATRVISAIRQTFAVSESVFSIRHFFDNPVIEHIGSKISAGVADIQVKEKKAQLIEAGKTVEEGVFL